MDKPLVHPNFAQPSLKNTSTPSPTTTSPTTTTQTHKTTSPSTIQYDHETYLELLAGQNNHVEKTASQVYEEVGNPLPSFLRRRLAGLWVNGYGGQERARELSLRAQDPAVLSGPLELDVDVYRFEFGDCDVAKK